MNLSKRLNNTSLTLELKQEDPAQQKESAIELRRQLELKVIEDYKYSFTEDFTLCYQCGMEKYLKHYCVVCKENALLKKSGTQSVIQCQTCKGWCHVSCTHLPGRFKHRILSQELPFKCLNCLIKNRSLH